jgi:hypothetical protein
MLGSCGPSEKDLSGSNEVLRLITLDPGHFHAALVQKIIYPEVDSKVHIYALAGNDLQLHLARIENFNGRREQPTIWESIVYRGPDFLEKMLEEKKGNVVVLAGNNRNKTAYVLKAVSNGFHVLADKPMAINQKDFMMLEKAFAVAKEKKLLLYDIMTERFEITTMLQKELSKMPVIFGTLEKGSPENPAVTKESVHHFYKFVSGKPLIRPPWFFDTEQEEDGLVDVTTHLVDLIQWECFSGESLDYKRDIIIYNARHWPTPILLSEFREVTALEDYPEYLLKDVEGDNMLMVFCNGEIKYQIKGIHASVSVT